MGLYISHIRSLPADQHRSLYIYLLDYGWPDERFRQLFHNNFSRMAERASETKSIVLSSFRGIHFANEVLSFHRVGDFDGDDILPAILITNTHPSYFVESFDEHASPDKGMERLVLIPLKEACTDDSSFVALVESIFSDLEKGCELKDFRVSAHDPRRVWRGVGKRALQSVKLEPGAFGVSVDLKKLILG